MSIDSVADNHRRQKCYWSSRISSGKGLPSGCKGLAKECLNAGRWLEADGGNVSMAVTVVVWDDVERIVIKTWEVVGSSEEIACTQEVGIRRRDGKTVSTGGLRFPFKTIFGTDPDPNKPVEKDIVLEEGDLVMVGKRAWWETFGKDVED